ncbi:hydrogenase maturation nickel metallochaperone HypA/HybF [Methylomonas sp. MgM2]
MHELSLCQNLLDQVTDIAQRHCADKVVQIIVRIGPLSGVEAKLLESAFEIASVGSVAEQAELLMESQAVKVFCNVCATESDASVNDLTCRQCGAYNTRLISGDELILARVELESMDQERPAS